jgi:hypothetical protein
LCVAALVIVIAFTACDHIILDDLIPNHGPGTSIYDWFKLAVAACLGTALVASILHDGRGTHSGSLPDEPRPWLVGPSLAVAAVFVLLFVASPTAFNWLSLEHNVAEYLSALFGVVGAAFFAGVVGAAWHLPDGSPNRRLTIVFAALCALVLFLLGMQEIMNLRNFLTTPLYALYRLGSWAVLILLPFMVTFGPRLRLFDAFHNFLPPPWIAAMSAPVACFNYNAWPFLPTQVVVVSSLLMMAVFWQRARQGGQEKAWLFGAATLLIIVAQVIFLVLGDRFIRHWDVTEYQECFMAFGLAAVGWAAWARVREHSQQVEVRLATKGR